MAALTLNQCRTLRLHHATQMIKNLNAKVRLCMSKSILVITEMVTAKVFVVQDFPPTKQDLLKVEQKEAKLQQADAKEKDSSSHCLAWKIKSCLFQRATGTSRCVDKKHDNSSVVYLYGIALQHS